MKKLRKTSKLYNNANKMPPNTNKREQTKIHTFYGNNTYFSTEKLNETIAKHDKMVFHVLMMYKKNSYCF